MYYFPLGKNHEVRNRENLRHIAKRYHVKKDHLLPPKFLQASFVILIGPLSHDDKPDIIPLEFFDGMYDFLESLMGSRGSKKHDDLVPFNAILLAKFGAVEPFGVHGVSVLAVRDKYPSIPLL